MLKPQMVRLNQQRWLVFAVALVACSNPATDASGSGAEADVVDPADGLLFQSDAKKQDVEKAPDSDLHQDVPDGAVVDVVDAGDALKSDATPTDTGTAAFGHLCTPCMDSAVCQTTAGNNNLCIPDGEKGSFCGSSCSLANPKTCPDGFVCESVPDTGSGQTIPQCRPTNGECGCSPDAIAQGLTAPCSKANSAGTCVGIRTCTVDGLTACDAPTPASETCNSLDDDCNGKTDDLASNSACSSSNAAGTCVGTVTGCKDGVALCNAVTPVAETCNGADDNCDGATDEGMCDDGNPCTTGICGSDGSCGQIPETGGPCDDGSACTDSDLCVKGKCKGQSTQCDDLNPCTTDGCDSAGGCTHVNSAEACTDDGNSCTIDVCVSGACSHKPFGDGATCATDGNPCTLDGCIAGACVHTDDPFDPPCTDDNNACTQDVCKASACAHVPVAADVTCTSDNDVCTDDLCNDGACQHPATATETTCADDGVACTNDFCSGGKCTHPALVSGSPCADDGKPCTDDVCQTGTCMHPAKAIGATCADDGMPCTTDTCQNGVCVHLATLTGQSCPDDGDPCTIDTCTKQGGCGHAIDPIKCQIAGVCYAAGQGSPTDPCLQCIPTSNQTGFSAAPGKPCEDGNLCTVGEMCTGGKCQGGGPKDCAPLNNDCGTAACDKATGTCVVTPKAGPCDDGDVCTASDHCDAGQCIGTAKDCSPFDAICATGTCIGGTCSSVPKVGGCNDGDPCTLNDVCNGTKCAGTTLDCSGINSVCGTGSCQAGVCVATPKVGSLGCDDGNGCTYNDQCTAGLCVGTAVNCANLNGPCQAGVCDPATTGCVLKYSTKTTSCTDGDACTLSDHCDGAGKCSGTAMNCPGNGNPCAISYCAGGKCTVSPTADGAPCNDNSACTTSDVCGGGACNGLPVMDKYEINNSADGASLGSKSDCDGASSLNASISPAQDIDYFSFAASDDIGCSIYPDVGITNLAADYDLCVWFRCSNGTSDSSTVGCDAGYLSSGGPGGEWGCCSSNGGTASEHVRHNDTCSFLGLGNDGGTVTIQVFPKNAAAGAMCGGYTVTWKAN